jgi:hypothetical protein
MLAMAVISVSVGATSVIDDFNDINAIKNRTGCQSWPMEELRNGV